MKKLNMYLGLAKVKLYNFLHDEKGDTNFISIMVLLGIALALAGVFLSFQKEIMGWVETNIGSFFSTNVKTREG